MLNQNNLIKIKKLNYLLIFIFLIPIIFLSYITLADNPITPFECGSNVYDDFNDEKYDENPFFFYDLNLSENIGNLKCINRGYLQISEQGEGKVYINIINPNVFNVYFSFLLVLILYLIEKDYLKNILMILTYLLFQNVLIFYKFNILFLNLLIGMFVINFAKSIKVKSSSDYLPGVDLLRAIAVSAVILNHLDSELVPMGYLGVDVFFVISGFIITKRYLTKDYSSKKEFIKRFFEKRIRRLWPALFTMVIGVTLIYFNFDLFFKTTLETSSYALLGLSNIYFIFNSFDYFSQTSKYNPLLHTWSLGVEEQFYLLYPIIFYLIISKNKSKYSLFFVYSASIFLFFILFNSLNAFAYYSIITRFWQILSGVAVAVLFSNYKKSNRFINSIFLILLIFIFFQNSMNQIHHFNVVVLTSLILANNFSLKVNKFTNPLLQIGIISYSLYLWHHPIFTIKQWNPDLAINDISLLLLTFLISIFSFRYIETVFREKFLLNIEIKYLLLIIIFSFLIVFLSFLSFDEYSEFQQPQLKYSELDLTPIYATEYCHSPNDDFNLNNEIFDTCLMRQSVFQKTIYLIGDSHMTNHYKSLKRIGNLNKYNVNLLVEKGLREDLFSIEDCVIRCGLKDGVKSYISFFEKNIGPQDFVIISFDQEKFYDLSTSKSIIFKEKIKDLNKSISSNEGNMFLLDDIPKPCLAENRNFSLEIIKLGLVDTCESSVDSNKMRRNQLTKIYLQLANHNMQYLDPMLYLCENDNCGVIKNNKLIYGDFSPHVTEYGSSLLDIFWENEFDFRN
tara:strand:+ start:1228 stop:3600 length:2373 start_codon:yes stop_codon:yes gene_type:complete